MKWSEFGPYVLPDVIGVPEPMLWLHARLASIEFCRRTLCDTLTLDPSNTDGTTTVELELPPETQIIKIKAVEVAGRDHPLVTPIHGNALVRSQSGQPFCFLANDLTLAVYPAQPKKTKVTADVALAPSIEAEELRDTVAAQYAQDIANGVVARLKKITNQVWSDPTGAVDAQQRFLGRISTVAAKVGRGQVAAKMRNRVTYL
ncbi:MAG: hypothetical protein HEQ39_09995 [Rhizobacter sp.]